MVKNGLEVLYNACCAYEPDMPILDLAQLTRHQWHGYAFLSTHLAFGQRGILPVFTQHIPTEYDPNLKLLAAGANGYVLKAVVSKFC